MAQVVVTVDGKPYRMACEEGQEGHLTELAARFDQYVGHLKGHLGEIGDLRLTVMAAIMVTDELNEASRKLKAIESEVEGLRSGRDAVLSENHRSQETIALALSQVTSQINGITARLNGRLPAPTN